MNNDLAFIAPANSIHSLKWISSIAERDNRNIYWITFHDFEYDNARVKKVKFDRNLRGVLNAVLFIKKHVNGIVHIHSLGFHLLFFVISKFVLSKKKIITTPWGSDLIYGRYNFIKRLVLKDLFKKSTLITCDAIFMKKLIEEIYPLARVELINFGVDTEKFAFIKREFVKNKKLKLLSIRNLEEVYNIECIIKMMRILSKKGLNVELSIYSDGSSKEKLQRLTTSLNLDNEVKFYGRYSQDELIDVLSNHDIYISMARSDAGLAASTAEAMSSGMICMVSDVAENSFWISHNETGFLIPDNDHKELARNIELIIRDRIDLSDMGEKARKKILTSNSINGEMEKMNSIYIDLDKSIV